jgi:outer membrane cobalamin receptor
MTYDKQMIYTPLHRFNFNLAAEVAPFTFNIWVNYSSESYFTGDNDPFNKLDSYYTIDASVVMSVQAAGMNHILSASVYNMLNRNYMIVQSYPMPLFTAAFTYKLLLEY